ncbi:MAG TPA: AsmA family protein [Spirochaetota bacterium]|nr:AsmA family protein [Spirochaetota bacterium]
MKSIKIKIFKAVLSVFIILVLLIAAGGGLFIYFFPKEKIKEIAIDQARKTINREITIGDLHYSPSGIVLSNVGILNRNIAGAPESEKVFAQAEDIYLRFSIFDLLEKKIKFSYIYLENFRFNIIFDENGESNLAQFIKELTEKKESPISASISNIKLHNTVITLQKAPESLKPLEGTYMFDGQLRFAKDGSILIAESELRLPEDRGTMYPELTVNTGPEGFKITGGIGLKKTSLIWVYRWATTPKPFYLITGDITGLVITKDAVEGFVKASSTLTNSKHTLYADGFCRVSIKDRTILIANADGKINDSKLWFNYLQFTWAGTNVRFSAKNIDAQVVDVIPLVDPIPRKLYGRMTGELSYERGIWNANGKVYDVGYDKPNNTISGVTTELTIINNLFTKSNIRAAVLGQPCTASLASTDKTLTRVFLNVKADRFVFPHRSEGEYRSLDLTFPLEVTGQAEIGEFLYGEYRFSNVQGHYLWAGNRAILNSFTAGFMEGSVKGRASVDANVKPPELTAGIIFDGVKLQRLFEGSKLFGNRLFGNVGGSANITLNLRENLLDSIRGKAEFSIDRGKVTNTGIQNGLGIWLAELKYKIMDLEFNKIYGNIEINGPKYTVNSFIFNSQNIRFNIKGVFTDQLVADPISINMEFSKYFIQDIARPLVVASGYNKYLRGDWYYIPFQVNGDLTDSRNIKKLY